MSRDSQTELECVLVYFHNETENPAARQSIKHCRQLAQPMQEQPPPLLPANGV